MDFEQIVDAVIEEMGGFEVCQGVGFGERGGDRRGRVKRAEPRC
jgi:hypothetical protein